MLLLKAMFQLPISVSQFMGDLAAEELIVSRCDNNIVSYLSQYSLRVCFTEVALNQMLLDNKKEDPNL
jgi:hypothetical protein